jgi:hypothetical protein
MAIYKIFLCAGWLIAVQAFAEAKIDKKDKINGVLVQSAKDESARIYKGAITKSFPHSIDSVKQAIINFADKCNNSYKDRRKYTDKNFHCKYHNEHLVETQVIRKIKQTGWTKEEGEVDRFLLARQVYNRGSFGYYELVRIYESKDAENKRTIRVVQTMLTDSQVKNYTTPIFEKDSAFDKSISTFTLTEVKPNETALSYEYNAETKHWILNKEVSVPQVFASISKSINDLVKTVVTESAIQSRDVASN